jgi:phosphate butyryltransferase
MKSFADILAATQKMGPKKIAIAGEPNDELADALNRAAELGIGEAVIFETANDGAVAVRDGEADVFMKGSVDTPSFMRAVLDKENDFRTGRLINHVFVFEAFDRLMLLTDAGICIDPNLDDKAETVRNIVPVARRLGIETPKIAVLAAIEKINPKMPTTLDADALSKMDLPDCHVQGPLALDLAVSPGAAATKGIPGPVAGQADVLLMPNVETGNILAKALMYMCHCGSGGVVSGTKRPVTFSSRSDSADTKLHTIALGVLMS